MVKRGRIVEQGTHDQLMGAGGAYFTLIQMQQATGDVSEDDDDDAAGAGAAPAGWQPEAPSEHWQVRGGCGMVGVGRTLAVLQTVWKVDRARACKPCCRAAPRECRPPLLLLASLQNGGALPASPRSGSGPARFSLDAPSMASDGSQGVILGTLQKAGGWLRRGGWRPVALCSAVLLALQSPGSFPGAGGSGLLSAAPTLALHCLQARRWWRCCQTGSWPPRRARAPRWRPACRCRCARGAPVRGLTRQQRRLAPCSLLAQSHPNPRNPCNLWLAPAPCLLVLQRDVSGLRRFISFRRKSTRRRRLAPKEAKEVDHRKSTEEEAAKKVGAGGWDSCV